MKKRIRSSVRAVCRATIATGLGLALGSAMVASAIPLANQPVFSTSEVPGNLALALSVEWPTASRTAHVGNYSSGTADATSALPSAKLKPVAMPA